MSKFKVWIDDSQVTNMSCQSADIFASDPQREKGFKANTGASAIRVNTALRQANLIAVALVNALGISDTFDVTSRLEDMTTWFSSTNLLKVSRLFTVGDAETYVNNSIQPSKDNSFSLGISTKRFSALYSVKINDFENFDDSRNVVKSNTTIIEKRRLVASGRITTSTTMTFSVEWQRLKMYEICFSQSYSGGLGDFTEGSISARFIDQSLPNTQPAIVKHVFFHNIDDKYYACEATFKIYYDRITLSVKGLNNDGSTFDITSRNVAFIVNLYEVITEGGY